MATAPIHFGIQTPQEGVSFDALVAHWRCADDVGFDSVWLDDHFYSVLRPRSEPQMEAWTLLAALARETQRTRIGILVSCNGYRNPALLAKMAATVDVLSNGRLIHGIGAGWFADEYEGYGYDFPDAPTRLAQLDEALAVQKALWTADRPSFDGRVYRVREAWCEPRPVQRPYPPILIGGGGERVLLRLVARHADMWNCPGEPGELARKIEVLRRHCAAEGRPVDAIERTWFGQVIVDADAVTPRADGDRLGHDARADGGPLARWHARRGRRSDPRLSGDRRERLHRHVRARRRPAQHSPDGGARAAGVPLAHCARRLPRHDELTPALAA
jgi:F420-dependent oxidoreductase-like protein